MKSGTYYCIYHSAVTNEDGTPFYSNIVLLGSLEYNAQKQVQKTLKFKVQESALLTPTTIKTGIMGESTGFIPSCNDRVELYYGHTDKPNEWVNMYTGMIASKPQTIAPGIYTFNTYELALFSNDKAIGTVIQDGVNFKNRSSQDVLQEMIKAQSAAANAKIIANVSFDKDISKELLKKQTPLRVVPNTKLDTALQKVLTAFNFTLISHVINEQNGTIRIDYVVTDKYTDPRFTTPFFNVSQNEVRVENQSSYEGAKQAVRLYFNTAAPIRRDITGATLPSKNYVIIGDTFYNLSGTANTFEETPLDTSYLTEIQHKTVKTSRKSRKMAASFEQEIVQKLNKQAHHKIQQDIMANGLYQVAFDNGIEIPPQWITEDGSTYTQNRPLILELGMRFKITLEQYGVYDEELIITQILLEVTENMNRAVVNVVPLTYANIEEKYLTLPGLRAMYEKEMRAKTGQYTPPTVPEMINFIYRNPKHPEARFQLSLANPAFFSKEDVAPINTRPQFIKKVQ